MIPGSGNNQISLEAPEKAGKSSDPPGNLRKVMKHGSSIPAENVLVFSDDLRTCPAETNGKLAESHRKNQKKFRPENCFHIPSISDVFLQESARTS